MGIKMRISYEKDLVSVCVTTYNRPKLILRCVDSILSQTYQKLELIICDNSESDETQKLVANIKDKRVRYYKNDYNIGLSHNLIKAFSLARGEFVTWLGDDDVMFRENLKKKVEFCKKNPHINVVASGYRYNSSNITNIPPSDNMIEASYLIPGTKMYNHYPIIFVTMLFRAENTINIIKESWKFYYESYLFYVLGGKEKKIGFLQDILLEFGAPPKLGGRDPYKDFRQGEQLIPNILKDPKTLRQVRMDQYRAVMRFYPETYSKLYTKEVQRGILNNLCIRIRQVAPLFTVNNLIFFLAHLDLLSSQEIMKTMIKEDFKRKKAIVKGILTRGLSLLKLRRRTY